MKGTIGWFVVWALLAAILVAVIVQGNRILYALPYPPDVQDVHVVNAATDRVPVELPTERSASIAGVPSSTELASKWRQQVQQWPAQSSSIGSHATTNGVADPALQHPGMWRKRQ